MNTYDEKGNLVTSKPSMFKRATAGVGALGAGTGVLMMSAVPAHAALDLSKLTEEFTSVSTAVTGVIAVAITIGIAIVGWKWAKRALFSV